jgi:hypothetical protein
MNARTTLWRCRSPACGVRGNAADYLAGLRALTRSEAMRLLEERYGGPGLSTAPGELEAHVNQVRASYYHDVEQRVRPDLGWYRDHLGVDWSSGPYEGYSGPCEYLLGRGFATETLDDFEVGYDERSDRLTIPVFDAHRALVGVKARAWRADVQPRYLSLGHQLGEEMWRYPFHTYHKSDHVFALDRAEGESGVLVEGELNQIALTQMGVLDAVAVAGAEFSEAQRRLVVSHFDSLVVYFDDDLAGHVGARRVVEALSDDIQVRVVEHAGCDAAEALEPGSRFRPLYVMSWIFHATPSLSYRVQSSYQKQSHALVH